MGNCNCIKIQREIEISHKQIQCDMGFSISITEIENKINELLEDEFVEEINDFIDDLIN